ncbi:hypothetical protein J15TS10_41670 [Paenibacillus woosongensis]|uniref:Uncharacterized protein n=1 Tax=Paenibacillus woosongensis TaxID=307580 RepID=A0ABQ4MWN9_9BACL|nr:hypothetical protein J15TS10_41670 [Paenibacillus woosongensis]
MYEIQLVSMKIHLSDQNSPLNDDPFQLKPTGIETFSPAKFHLAKLPTCPTPQHRNIPLQDGSPIALPAKNLLNSYQNDGERTKGRPSQADLSTHLFT